MKRSTVYDRRDVEDREYLLISGLQHFSFCRRQWALIHVEQQWVENGLTAEGRMIHKRVHDVSSVDIRNGIITVRDMPVLFHLRGVREDRRPTL